MKINLRKATASVLTAAGLLWGASTASAVDHAVGDPSFEQIGLGALDYYYFTGPPNSPFWRRKSGGSINAAYNTNYATVTSPNTPDPRTGNQAVDGEGAYDYQVLNDVFVAGRTYTYTAYTQGWGNNVSDSSDRFWMYLFAGTGVDGGSPPGSLDGGSLIRAAWHSNGVIDNVFKTGAGAHEFLPFTGFNRNAGSAWTQVGVSYTATLADDGKRIGIGFWANELGAVDDIGLSSIPEPSTVFLAAAGVTASGLLRRRRRVR
jgi:hypothetical protein